MCRKVFEAFGRRGMHGAVQQGGSSRGAAAGSCMHSPHRAGTAPPPLGRLWAALSLAGCKRRENWCEMRHREAEAKYGFSHRICETWHTHLVSGLLSSTRHSQHSPAAGSMRLQMRHNCLSNQCLLNQCAHTSHSSSAAQTSTKRCSPQSTVWIQPLFSNPIIKLYYKPLTSHAIVSKSLQVLLTPIHLPACSC